MSLRRIPRSAQRTTPRPLFEAALDGALAAAAARRQALLGLEDALSELLLRATTRLVGDALRLQPELVRAIARAELRHLARAERVTLFVHPDDVALVAGLDDEVSARLTVCSDAQLARGDCVLASPLGDIDARMTTKLARLGRALEREPAR